MAKLANKFEVGCDPEFVVVGPQGQIVSVASLGGGKVGFDHAGRCVELRPEQARGTFTLVRRLKSLLDEAKLDNFRKFRWRAGAYYRAALVEGPNNRITLGGHVHFNITQANFPKGALKALDSFTGLLEHTEVLPRAECISRRTQTEYGKWGDIRYDTPDHHVEYRTMASWLFNPWVTFMALTGAKLAVVAPEAASEALADKTSRRDISAFFERFRNKDINADRVLDKLERPSWLEYTPDVNIKDAWEKPL